MTEEELIGQVQVLVQENKVSEAIALLEEAVSASDQSKRLLKTLGNLYSAVDRPDEGIPTLSKAQSLDPDDPEIYKLLIPLFEGKGDLGQVLACLKHLIRLEPDEPLHSLVMATTLIEMDKPDQAIPLIDHYLAQNPASPRERILLGNAFMLNRQYPEAIYQFNLAIRMDPTVPEAFKFRGNSFARAHKYRRAIWDFSRALTLRPNDGVVLHERGRAYGKIGARSQGAADLRAAAIAYQLARDDAACLSAQADLIVMQPKLMAANFRSRFVHSNRSLMSHLSGQSVSPYLLESRKPEVVLKSLVSARISAIEHRIRKGADPREAFQQLQTPINPILLCSVIALYSATGIDHESLLMKYVSGAEMSSLEASLLKIAVPSQQEMQRFLALEQQYIVSFLLLSFDMMLTSRYGNAYWYGTLGRQSSSAGKHAARITRERFHQLFKPFAQIEDSHNYHYRDIPEHQNAVEFNIHDLHLLAWMLANPVYLVMAWSGSLPMKPFHLVLIRHGFATNAAIHNARVFYEFELSESYKRLNAVLVGNGPSSDKRLAVEAEKPLQQNLSALVRRAYALYVWNPMEADAMSAEWSFAGGFLAASSEPHRPPEPPVSTPNSS